MATAKDFLLAQIGTASRKMAAERKTDDIIKFIGDHWYLWSADKRAVRQAIEDSYSDGDPTVEFVAEQLGIPEGVYFKRVNKADVQAAYLDFPKSPLFDIFLKCVEQQRSAEVCLFVVSGQSSCVITNMYTESIPGTMQHCFKSRQNAKDIYIFPVKETKDRMSKFNHEGETNEY